MAPPGFSLSDYLATLAYFEDLEADALAWLAQHCARRSFDAGEIIFLEGDRAAGLWMIEAGQVKIFKTNPDGVEHILHLLGPGSTFNDIASLGGGPNPANAAALTPSAIWLLPVETIDELLLSNNALARKIIRLLTERVRILVQQIEDLALYSVTCRLARFLLKQAEDPSLGGPGVTRTAIAAHLATTPETISRALRSLEEGGAIEFDRHRILITNIDVMRAIAGLPGNHDAERT